MSEESSEFDNDIRNYRKIIIDDEIYEICPACKRFLDDNYSCKCGY
ncbi:MAG: hypothetical protein AABY22_07905 [Nanoarchaeota archaeon]